MVTYMEPQTVPSYMSVECTRQTLCMAYFTSAPHAQPSLSNFPKCDSNFGELTHSRRTTNSDKIFQFPPKIKIPNSHIVRYTCQFEQYLTHRRNERCDHPSWAPTKEPIVSCWRYTPTPNRTASRTSWKLFVRTFCTQLYPNKITITFIPAYLNC